MDDVILGLRGVAVLGRDRLGGTGSNKIFDLILFLVLEAALTGLAGFNQSFFNFIFVEFVLEFVSKFVSKFLVYESFVSCIL